MSNLNQELLTQFVEQNIIIPFYDSRNRSLSNASLKSLLKKKNPYLFRSKNIKTGQDLVKEMLDAFLSSSEETIFGNLLERLAIFVCQKKFDGFKPKEGDFASVDLIFTRDKTTYIIGIKSDSVWGNTDSTRQMISNLQQIASLKYSNEQVHLVSGICYGKSKIKKYELYSRYTGQSFWELVSGDDNFYIKIIEPLGNAIRNRDTEFILQYTKKINQMTTEILNEFCTDNLLDWSKIVQFNSGK